jgi:hypothetical protein
LPDADQPAHGLIPLDESTRAILRQLRWRKPPRDPRRLWLAVAVAILLHVLFGWVIWQLMRPAPLAFAAPQEHDQAIEIRFIPRNSPVAAPPPLAVPVPPPPPQKAPPRRPRPVPKAEPVSKDAMTIRLPDAKPAASPTPKLVDQSGQALLPPPTTSAPAPEADYVQRMPTDSDKVMQHTTPINYTPTRLDKYWHRTSTVDDTLQKAVDATTVKKTFNLPRGVRIHCAISLAMLAGGCGGDPPPPPSKKDGDERLSMAPSQLLAKDPHPPTPPSIDSCIAMYRAGQPLAYGCPVDTPSRSVEKEKADAIKAAADKAALDKTRADALQATSVTH